jgi:hypothetical protein
MILKQLVASGSVITSLYSLRLRVSEYRLVITSPSATIVVKYIPYLQNEIPTHKLYDMHAYT